MAINKKQKAWLLAGAAAVVVLGGGLLAMRVMQTSQANQGQIVCADAPYRSITNGMSKAEVTAALGAPKTKRVKDSATQNFFDQGDRESSILEGWIYQDKTIQGGAGIYFDAAGRVNGKGCGQG
ncbi:MAG TPA: hypothetical protein VLF67_04740 [Candidatus Saccharimonas sp.]|nr:hypothetical protein [Candidatus Saccharimonas sp.]